MIEFFSGISLVFDDPDISGTLAVLCVLVIFSAFFSGCETAFMSLSKIRILYLVKNSRRNAGLVQKLRARPHKLLITILIGNNLANVAASSFATAFTIELLNRSGIEHSVSYGVGGATGITTLLLLIFGEIVPKSFCINHAETVALTSSPFIIFFQWIFYPLVLFFSLITRSLSEKYIRKRYPAYTEDEVRAMVHISKEGGGIKEKEKEMIENIFEFDNTQVKQVLTPRVEMFSLPADTGIKEAFTEIKDLPYSRIPVYEDEGNRDSITGIVHAKDIMRANIGGEHKSLRSLMRKPIFVPENMMIDALLREFRIEKTHIAVVVNEHGGVEGVVTIEDLLEQIVGDIYDESDISRTPVKKIDPRHFLLTAQLSLSELENRFGISLPKEGSYDTISGYILYKLGRVPIEGENVKAPGALLVVESADTKKIYKVMLVLDK